MIYSLNIHLNDSLSVFLILRSFGYREQKEPVQCTGSLLLVEVIVVNDFNYDFARASFIVSGCHAPSNSSSSGNLERSNSGTFPALSCVS